MLIKETRNNFYFYLVFHLAISDLGVALTGFDPYTSSSLNLPGVVCDVFGMLRTFFVMSTFILNFMISLTIYMAASKNVSGNKLLSNKGTFTAVNYLICFLSALGPLLTHDYGGDEIFCWIALNNKSITATFWVTLFAYIILPLSCLGILIFYILSIRALKKQMNKDQNFYGLFLIPLIFIVCNVLTVSNRLEANSEVLTFLHLTLRQSQGWIHSLIYAFGIIKQEIVNKWSSMKKKKKNLEEELVYSTLN